MTTLKELVDKGILNIEDKLIWRRRGLSVTHHALLTKEGFLKTDDGRLHKTPSGAARHLNNSKPVDGWLAWRVVGNGLSLAEIRKNFSTQ